MKQQGILYISYDGMLEPLGESQVLAYLERLAVDRSIDLISFEKAADWNARAPRDRIRARCMEAGIRWHPMRYHKRPSTIATAWDIAAGSVRATAIALRRKPAIVHVRSYVAGLMGLGARRVSGAKLLFDMRGFWADERVDGGLWPAGGRLYRAAKRAEDKLLKASDHIVTLTHASADELLNFPALRLSEPPITVIPTCADLDRFTPADERPKGRFVIGHIGAVGTWYLLDEMVRIYQALKRTRPDTSWLIVNRGEHALIRDALARHRVSTHDVELIEATPAEIPTHIRRMHAGMAIIRPAYSKIASAPTKLAEYLGCGVPCLGNSGVGDVQAILDRHEVGIVLHKFDDAAMSAAVNELLDLAADPDIVERCREAAFDLFSLEKGVAEYSRVYAELGA